MTTAFHSLTATLTGISMADTYQLQVMVVDYIDVRRVLSFQNGLAMTSGLFTITPWLISYTASDKISKRLSAQIKKLCSYGSISLQIFSWLRWLIPKELHPLFC